MFDFTEILSVTLILFSVIDILGSVPVIIKLRKQAGHIQSEKATIVAGLIMIVFLYLGEKILQLFGIDIESFCHSRSPGDVYHWNGDGAWSGVL